MPKFVNNAKLKFESLKSIFNIKAFWYFEVFRKKILYFIFRVLLFAFLLFIIYSINLNNINDSNKISKTYEYSLDKMGVNIVETSQNSDSISSKNIYKTYIRTELSQYPIKANGLQIEAFADYTDFKFSGFNGKLKSGEIIISDYIANYNESSVLKVGDYVELNNLTISNNSLNLSTNYKVKYIYKTDYLEHANDDTLIEDWCKYVFFSTSDIEKIKDYSLNNFGGVYLDNDIYIVGYSDKFNKLKYYNSISETDYQELEDDEFYAGALALSNLGLESISTNYEVYRNGSDEYYDITFKYNDKSITKQLKYKKNMCHQYSVVLSQNLYKELIDYFGINTENVLNSFEVKTLDVKNKDFKNLTSNLYTFQNIKFCNDSILNENYNKIDNLKINLTNLSCLYPIFTVCLIILLIPICYIDIRNYKYLKEYNYNTIKSTLLIFTSKVIIYIILAIILLILNFNILSIII